MGFSIAATSSSPLGYEGLDPFTNPPFIYADRSPTINDVWQPGTIWENRILNPKILYITTGGGIWNQISTSGGSSSFSSLTVTPGPVSLTGTTNINTSGAAVTSIGTGGTGAVNIGNATGNTAVTGSLSATGGITGSTGVTATNGNLNASGAGSGLLLNVTTASGASPQTANGRVFSVTFSGVSIAAGATQSFVINNSSVEAIGTHIVYSMVGATAGAALSIVSVTNVAGTSSTIVVTNGTGATTTTANITFTGFILD